MPYSMMLHTCLCACEDKKNWWLHFCKTVLLSCFLSWFVLLDDDRFLFCSCIFWGCLLFWVCSWWMLLLIEIWSCAVNLNWKTSGREREFKIEKKNMQIIANRILVYAVYVCVCVCVPNLPCIAMFIWNLALSQYLDMFEEKRIPSKKQHLKPSRHSIQMELPFCHVGSHSVARLSNKPPPWRWMEAYMKLLHPSISKLPKPQQHLEVSSSEQLVHSGFDYLDALHILEKIWEEKSPTLTLSTMVCPPLHDTGLIKKKKNLAFVCQQYKL